ncbi:MAG TPA: hypothetical protein VFQ61_35170 [Polyangiaceae bacterium]|nr:hypothetical protein [Polyangiaceae bacterium]
MLSPAPRKSRELQLAIAILSAHFSLGYCRVALAADPALPAATAAAAPAPSTTPQTSATTSAAGTTVADATVADATNAPSGAGASVEAKAALSTPSAAPLTMDAPSASPFRYQPSIPEPESGVARLPAEAYPNTPIRGIVGGSLWLTFHGLQWPYSPFVTKQPVTQLGLSGYVWLDTGYRTLDSSAPNGVDSKTWFQQGRFVLRATPTYSKADYFVQGQAELVGNKDPSQPYPGAISVDDVWLKAGRWNAYDVQVGRFEAWELYHLGMGMDQYTLERRGAYSEYNSRPAELYGVSFAYYRPSSLGNLAVHLYPTQYLRFELLGQAGNSLPQFGSTPPSGPESRQNMLAGRAAGVLDLGILKVKAGGEYLKSWPAVTTTQQDATAKGFGGSVQVVLDPHVEFGGNLAYNIIDARDATGNVDQAGSTDTYSFGGFANGRVIENLLVGVGVNYTTTADIKYDATNQVGMFSHLQGFGAVQYLLLDQLFLKAVVSYASANQAPGLPLAEYTDKMLGGRVRAMYLF